MASFADLVRLVGLEPVLGTPVLVRKDGDRSSPQLVGSPKGPHGDLAPVGDEHLVEHRSPLDRRADLPAGCEPTAVAGAGVTAQHHRHESPLADAAQDE